jgi:hypothetical protein
MYGKLFLPLAICLLVCATFVQCYIIYHQVPQYVYTAPSYGYRSVTYHQGPMVYYGDGGDSYDYSYNS